MAAATRDGAGDRAPGPPRRAWRSDLLLALVTAACLVPFADRALHVDDPLFVWAGDHIRRAPLDPYGFSVNWTRMATAPMYEVTKNPPLVPYFVAAIRALFGESERALHLGFLLPAIAAVLGTARLARTGPGRPELAALATLLTPVFLVSATTVMCDVTLLAFWVWSLVAWDRGLRRRSAGLLLLGASLAGLAFLAKYFGIALVPLLLAHGLAVRRRLGAWVLALAVPLAVVGGYEVWSAWLYGSGLLGRAFAFAGSARTAASLASAGLTGLIFCGGCLLPAAVFLGHAVGRGAALALLAAAGVLIAIPALRADAVDVHRVVFAAAGAFVLGLALDEALRRRGPEATLLLLWIAGTFAFGAWLNWEVNGRSFLPMAPAVGLLLARRAGELRLVRAWPLVPAAAISLAVAAGDAAQANAQREAAEIVALRHPPAARTLWCAGTWGFKYYLERAGARLLDASGSQLAPGDRLVAESRLWQRPGAEEALAPVDEIETSAGTHLATMDRATGAAFYAATHGRQRGPLPFAIGRIAPVRYHVMEARKAFAFRDAAGRRSAARHLVLISVDTLRADHLGAFGADLPLTPVLDAVARAGLRFPEARAPAPFTVPSVAALLTGRHPETLGVTSNRGRLAPQIPTLATLLRERGFTTGAVVSNPLLARGAGFATGFDVYDDTMPDREATRGQRERVASRTTDAALAVAQRLRAEGGAAGRVFLWVHYQDPHGPYTPPHELRARFLEPERQRAGGERELPVARDWRGIGGLPKYQFLPPFRRVAFYRAGYDGEVAYVDAEVGRLLAGLRDQGVLDRAAVVFTADHGEGLGESDHWFAHGEFLHEPALRVPLLVSAPGLRPAVRREPASLLDVVPTALALLGLPPASGPTGVDLGRPVPTREFHFTTGDAASARREAVLADGYKLVRSTLRRGESVALFRLPDEARDLAAQEPERVAELTRRLDARAGASAPPVVRELAPDEEKALRALGYAE